MPHRAIEGKHAHRVREGKHAPQGKEGGTCLGEGSG